MACWASRSRSPSRDATLAPSVAGVTGSLRLLSNLADATSSRNPSTGSGGTCFGDSGGPHFLGGAASTLEVAITVSGDSVCRATDKTYRIDTPSARDFLGRYVTLP